jgi:GH24 family phage-related lysozyme (muramidase)
MKITSNKFLAVLFCSAIFYQLFCNNFIAAENNTKIVKIDTVCSMNLMCSNIIEQTKNVEQKKAVKNSVKKYRLSKQGKDFIKSHEACVLHAYNDPDPKRRSVGWGHQIQPGEDLEHITQAKADELFEKDIEWVNDAINRLISKNDKRFVYTQGFIDGLGDLIYNCGEHGVTLTEFYSRWQKCRFDKNSKGYINHNDLNYTLVAVKTSRISAKGHIARRKATYEMMLN